MNQKSHKYKYKVLVVDDEYENRQLIIKALVKTKKYTVLGNKDSRQGFQQAVQEIPDAIVCDWNMPGMDGMEFLRRIKSHPITCDIPVVIASGVYKEAKHVKEALEKLAHDYIKKPIDGEDLIARVEAAIKYTAKFKAQLVEQQRQIDVFGAIFLQMKSFIDKQLQQNPNAKEVKEYQEQVEGLIKKSMDIGYFDKLKSYLPNNVELTPTEMNYITLLSMNLEILEVAKVLSVGKGHIYNTIGEIKMKFGLGAGKNVLRDFLIKVKLGQKI